MRSIAQSIIDRDGHRGLVKDGDKIIMRLYGTADYIRAQADKFMADSHTLDLVPFCPVHETYHPEDRVCES